MKKKAFDCVEMKHRGAMKVLEKLADLTFEQQVAYWQERTRILRRRQEMMKGKRKSA